MYSSQQIYTDPGELQTTQQVHAVEVGFKPNFHSFNIGGSGCLGLNVFSPEQPLSIYECDSTHVS